MEQQEKRETRKERMARHQKSKLFAGVLIIAFGVLFLMDRLGANIPNWIYSWKMILIAIGAVTLYKHKFQNFGGWVLITIGTVFIINDHYKDLIDASLLLPAFVILFGVLMVGKSMNVFGKKKPKRFPFDDGSVVEDGEYMEATALFGNVKKNIVSKDFKGGQFSSVFGGIQLNLIKADIQGPITVNTDVVFGGMKLYIPPTWDVIIETTAIFGGVEDKRPMLNDENIDPNKIITLTGNCIFGGIEIVNYF
ncbi:MAG TPA: hypothetical protein EYG86_01170 [Crocinitomicaceae bacterium]|nr:hypothetical protein [Crocinitomicaceae bacterium]